MKDLLLALPVKGDAFVLRRDRYAILVDGGWDSGKLALALKNHAADLNVIDVAVCTHADRDHAGGLMALLDEWPGRIRQFWLPGSWADVTEELLTDTPKLVAGLIEQLRVIAHEYPAMVGPDATVDAITETLDSLVRDERRLPDIRERPRSPDHDEDGADKRDRETDPDDLDPADRFDLDIDDTVTVDEPEWFQRLRTIVHERADAAARAAFRSGRTQIAGLRRRRTISDALAEFWLGLIQTAEAIRAIARQAIKHHVRIRWFDFDEFARTRIARGGVPGFLLPLNAVEQVPLPRPTLSYLALLSPVNEACLAFVAPPTFWRLGVVFCGDSPLGDGKLYRNSLLTRMPRPHLPLVATAPHHGSESNQVAYGHLQQWANILLWLRTGGSKSHPGAEFKKVPFPQRLCTHCPQTERRSQLAFVAMTRGDWSFGPLLVKGHECACR